eukprot:jgi/Bigna1/140307/aug1.55_g15015
MGNDYRVGPRPEASFPVYITTVVSLVLHTLAIVVLAVSHRRMQHSKLKEKLVIPAGIASISIGIILEALIIARMPDKVPTQILLILWHGRLLPLFIAIVDCFGSNITYGFRFKRLFAWSFALFMVVKLLIFSCVEALFHPSISFLASGVVSLLICIASFMSGRNKVEEMNAKLDKMERQERIRLAKELMSKQRSSIKKPNRVLGIKSKSERILGVGEVSGPSTRAVGKRIKGPSARSLRKKKLFEKLQRRNSGSTRSLGGGIQMASIVQSSAQSSGSKKLGISTQSLASSEVKTFEAERKLLHESSGGRGFSATSSAMLSIASTGSTASGKSLASLAREKDKKNTHCEHQSEAANVPQSRIQEDLPPSQKPHPSLKEISRMDQKMDPKMNSSVKTGDGLGRHRKKPVEKKEIITSSAPLSQTPRSNTSSSKLIIDVNSRSKYQKTISQCEDFILFLENCRWLVVSFLMLQALVFFITGITTLMKVDDAGVGVFLMCVIPIALVLALSSAVNAEQARLLSLS